METISGDGGLAKVNNWFQNDLDTVFTQNRQATGYYLGTEQVALNKKR